MLYYTAVESFTQLSEGRENTQKELRKQTLLKPVHCILGAFETSIAFSEMDHGFLDDGAVIVVVFIVAVTMKKMHRDRFGYFRPMYKGVIV